MSNNVAESLVLVLVDKITVRHFSLADLGRIIELENTSFTIDAFRETTFISYYHKCHDLFIVVELATVIVGYMLTCCPSPETGLIVSIAVDPNYRRKGIGRILTEYTLEHLKNSGIRTVELRVRVSNNEGRSFWESIGFRSLISIPHFYRDGAEALHMEKVLRDS